MYLIEKFRQMQDSFGQYVINRNSHLAKLLSGSMILTSANIAQSCAMLLVVSLIIKRVGIANYGILVLSQSFALTLTRLFDLQPWQAYIRAIGLGYSKRNALQVGIILDGIALIGVVLAAMTASFVLRWWQLQPIPFEISALFAFSVLNQCAFSWIGILRAEGKFLTLALITLLPSLLRLFALVAYTILGNGLTLYLVAWTFATTEGMRFAFIVSAGWQQIKKDMGQTQSSCVKKTWQGLRNFIFWNWLMHIVDLPVQYLDSLLVGKFLCLEAAGTYGIIKRIASVCSQMAAPLYQVIFPEFTRLIAGNAFHTCRQLLLQSIVIMLTISLLIMASLFYGRVYWMPLLGLSQQYTIAVFLFMAFQMLAVAFTMLHSLMDAIGLAKTSFYIVFFSNSVFLIALYILISHYHLLGIVMATGLQFMLVISLKFRALVQYLNVKR